MNLISAITLNNCIGNNGKLVCKIPSDLKRFKSLTKNGIVIMGRKTFTDDLENKPLPNRVNIVVTNSRALPEVKPDLFFVNSPEEALNLTYGISDNTWVIGGASIYQDMLPYVNRLYLTHIHSVIEGDTYLNIDFSKWAVDNEHYFNDYSFVDYKLK